MVVYAYNLSHSGGWRQEDPEFEVSQGKSIEILSQKQNTKTWGWECGSSK
jgi:hypothetical protein